MWEKIEYYDCLIEKPENCVFYFPECLSGKMSLPETIQPKRTYGARVCTHFFLVGKP